MTIDWTIVAFEILNFGVLVVLLSRLLFKPVREVLERRRTELQAHDAETTRREQAADTLRARYEAEMSRIGDLAQERADAALAQAQERANALLEDARTHAGELLAQAQREAEGVNVRALDALRRDIFRLATDAARRVVTQLDPAAVALAYARRGAHALAQSDRLASLSVIHVSISDDVDAQTVEASLREVLGANLRMEFAVDRQLVGGVRLRGDGVEVESSAGHSLEQWYRRSQATA